MNYSVGLISLYVRDMARARTFYTGVLGLREVPQFSSPAFAFLESTAGTPIALVDVTTLPPGTAVEPGGVSLSFAVDDVQAAHADWKARGIEGVSDITDMGAGLIFYMKDPDGHDLSVHQLHQTTLDMIPGSDTQS